MKQNEFAIVLASDNRGVLPLSVTVYSLLSTAFPETFYKVYILSDGIDDENKKRLERLTSSFDCRLEFIEISEVLAKYHFPFTEQWPVSAWGRVFIPELLTHESGNVLYMDIDVLVCQDLTELFQVDLSGKAIGVVFEIFSEAGSHFNERLDIPLSCSGYFNSGVMLMNVDFFREHGLVNTVLEYADNYRDRLICPDQDALNGALCGETLPLHPRWNWHDGLTRRILKSNPKSDLWRGATPRQAIEAAINPGILHYQGIHKPWEHNWRYEGARYEKVMRDAELLCGSLKGRSPLSILKKYLYKPVYWLTRNKIRNLAKRFEE